MSLDRAPAHVLDMLRFTQELRSFAEAADMQSFVGNRVLCLAAEKLFINLGEAAFRIGGEGPQRWPRLPWRQVIGLRNVLAHGYEQVAHEVLYKTIRDDLPALETELAAILAAMDDGISPA